jgi:hypothetical protein
MNKIIAVFILLLLASCNGNDGLSNKLSKMQINYLHQITKSKVDNSNFLLVPPNICHPCVNKIYDYFSKNKCGNVSIIIIGGIKVDSLQLKSKLPTVSIYLDREEYYFNKKYTGIAKNNIVYITVQDNIVSNYLEITVANIDKSLEHITAIGCN